MKKFGIALAIALALVGSLAAEGTVMDSKGTMGLQFSLSGFGTFGLSGVTVDVPGSSGSVAYALVDYGLGCKYYVADRFAVGASIYLGGTNLLESGDPSATKVTAFSLKPFAAYTLLKKGPVALNAGGYLSLGFANSEAPTLKTARNVFGFGGIVGAEYFLGSGISLGANYELGANFYKSNETVLPGNVTASNSYSYFGVGTGAVTLTFYL